MLESLFNAVRSIVDRIRGAAKAEDEAKAKKNREDAEREVAAAEAAEKEKKP